MPFKSDEKRRAYQRANWKKYADPKRRAATAKKRTARTRAWLREFKEAVCCEKCGESHPACLQFHHRDPATKSGHMADLVKSGMSVERLKAEIAKCQVLCANCHAKLHWGQKHAGVEQ